jgi:hypothetical protein
MAFIVNHPLPAPAGSPSAPPSTPPDPAQPAQPTPYATGDRIADALLPSLEPVIRDWIKRDAPPAHVIQTVYQVPGVPAWTPPDGERTHSYFPLALTVAAAGEHLWLVSGAGTGKSHLAGQLAEALGREYEVDSFSSQTTEAKLLGYTDANGAPVITPLARAFEHGKVFIADEADAATAVTVGLNRALANNSATMAGRQLARHTDFLCLATANTRGSGQAMGFRREPIDVATLDRFFMLELPADPGLERYTCGLPPSPKYQSPPCDVSRGGTLTPEEWFDFVYEARAKAAALQVQATFRTSRRPITSGCKLAAAGVGKYWLAQGLLRRSLSVNDWDKLASALNVEP